MHEVPLTIGLTGGIGSGKSAVSGMFRQLGVPVFDADEISHDVTRPGGAAYGRVVELAGADCLAADGKLDRGRLRRMAFEDDRLRRGLEAIIHPLVSAELRRRIEGTTHPYCLVSIPLLVETGARSMVDRVLVVDLPEKLQVERTCVRDNVPEEDVRRIMRRQAGREQRLAAADDVITNVGSRKQLETEVRALHHRYLALARDSTAAG